MSLASHGEEGEAHRAAARPRCWTRGGGVGNIRKVRQDGCCRWTFELADDADGNACPRPREWQTPQRTDWDAHGGTARDEGLSGGNLVEESVLMNGVNEEVGASDTHLMLTVRRGAWRRWTVEVGGGSVPK